MFNESRLYNHTHRIYVQFIIVSKTHNQFIMQMEYVSYLYYIAFRLVKCALTICDESSKLIFDKKLIMKQDENYLTKNFGCVKHQSYNKSWHNKTFKINKQ